jgi:hypothetical protein
MAHREQLTTLAALRSFLWLSAERYVRPSPDRSLVAVTAVKGLLRYDPIDFWCNARLVQRSLGVGPNHANR